MSNEKNMFPIAYRCDPKKNKTCEKTLCQKLCFYSLNQLDSVDGKRYRYNDATDKFEVVDT